MKRDLLTPRSPCYSLTLRRTYPPPRHRGPLSFTSHGFASNPTLPPRLVHRLSVSILVCVKLMRIMSSEGVVPEEKNFCGS